MENPMYPISLATMRHLFCYGQSHSSHLSFPSWVMLPHPVPSCAAQSWPYDSTGFTPSPKWPRPLSTDKLDGNKMNRALTVDKALLLIDSPASFITGTAPFQPACREGGRLITVPANVIAPPPSPLLTCPCSSSLGIRAETPRSPLYRSIVFEGATDGEAAISTPSLSVQRRGNRI